MAKDESKDDGFEAEKIIEILPLHLIKADTPEENPKIPVARFLELFSVADSKDKCYIGTAFSMAVLSGCNQPAQLIIFGSILNAFNGASPADSIRMVSLLAAIYVGIGGQIFITSFAQTACMSTAAGRQTKRLRELYFESLLRQCISYFDANDQGALATSVMERTLIIQDGIGEKLALGVQFFSSFVAGLIVALYYVWQLALLMMGVVSVSYKKNFFIEPFHATHF
jgi:ATP-binding cassette subfamily B (MDR/TAP) protein 1